MGILHKLVFILGKLDPRNEQWEQRQIQRVRDAVATAEKIEDAAIRERTVKELEQQITGIEDAFNRNELDYGRKLYLIENCLYGVDIQSIAVQIAKMRFFISLIVDQRVDPDATNLGVRPLPNLETKFVAANTLIGIEKPKQAAFRNPDIDAKEAELRKVREKHFNAKTLTSKAKFREQDKRLRSEVAELLKRDGWGDATAKQLATWDPYDQNASAPFFDPEWMFGVQEGFDVVIGNPPYIDSESMAKDGSQLRELIQASYKTTKGNWDIYIAFYEKGFGLVAKDGVLSFITPDKWISKPFGDEMRIGSADSIFSILKAGRSVFESVYVDAIVTVFINRPQPYLRICDYSGTGITLKRVIRKSTLKPPFAYDWLFSDSLDLLLALETRSEKVSKHGACENACATSDAYKLQEFIEEEPKTGNSTYLRIVNTGTIGKYVSKWGRREMVYLGHKYSRPVVDKQRFCNAFQNSYGKKALKPKIIVKGLNLLDACLDADGTIIPGKTTLIVTADNLVALKFLLSILNSAVAFFYLREKYPASSYNQGTTFTKEMINDLPLPRTTPVDRGRVVSFVDRILAAKKADPAADTAALEREIDEMVYKLYGLTEEDIAIIEGRE